jgi:hypothetical protein
LIDARAQPLAVYGVGDKGAGLALMMKHWSTDVVLLTDGPSEISPEIEARLQRHRIQVYSEQIAGLEGTDDGALQFISLRGGKTLKRNALFFTTGCRQASELSASLGCVRDEKGGIVADPVTEESSVPGVRGGDVGGGVALRGGDRGGGDRGGKYGSKSRGGDYALSERGNKNRYGNDGGKNRHAYNDRDHKQHGNSHNRHRVFRNGVWIWAYGPDYAYSDDCAWLRRQAAVTGSPLWWDRYNACVSYDYY